jgi:hypothetical protein
LYINKINYNYDEQFKIFLKSKEYKIVKYLSDNENDRFYIYSILFPEKFQRNILKNKFVNVIKPIMHCELFYLLYFIKSYKNIHDIIHYFSCKLNI